MSAIDIRNLFSAPIEYWWNPTTWDVLSVTLESLSPTQETGGERE